MPTKIYRTNFWMKKHGSKTMKRTSVWSNSVVVSKLDLGKVIGSAKKSKIKTTTRYVDKKGVLRFQGTAHLKGTQNLRSTS